MFPTSHSFPSTTSDHISIEANSDERSYQPNQSDLFDELDFESLFGSDVYLQGLDVAGTCISTDLINSINSSIDFDQFDQYPSDQPEPNTIADIDPNQLALNNLPVYPLGKTKRARSSKKPIPLSSSVGIGAPQRSLNPSRKLEIVYGLEEKYRPRYKTDYFALNGTNRKPRYVTDRHGNHYITLRVPQGIQGQIRIDWLTVPDDNGDRYVMPYRFQINNNLDDGTDCNPTYEDIRSDPGSSFLKLYLVLIKAKQDVLKALQPLQTFRPFQDLFGMNEKQTPEKATKISPKKLIQKYQLGKSQLAFTLCTPSADRQTYLPEWDTTVYSTVLEEESTENSTADKTVSCPNCLTQINISEDETVVQETGVSKRKSLPIMTEKTKIIKKQKSISDSMIFFE